MRIYVLLHNTLNILLNKCELQEAAFLLFNYETNRDSLKSLVNAFIGIVTMGCRFGLILLYSFTENVVHLTNWIYSFRNLLIRYNNHQKGKCQI